MLAKNNQNTTSPIFVGPTPAYIYTEVRSKSTTSNFTEVTAVLINLSCMFWLLSNLKFTLLHNDVSQ